MSHRYHAADVRHSIWTPGDQSQPPTAITESTACEQGHVRLVMTTAGDQVIMESAHPAIVEWEHRRAVAARCLASGVAHDLVIRRIGHRRTTQHPRIVQHVRRAAADPAAAD